MKKSSHKKHKVTRKKQTKQSVLRNLLQFFIVIPVVLFFLASFANSIATKAHAATGLNRVINFQGRVVKKADGTNVTDGSYSFTFKLFDAASAGNLLWQETQSTVTVTNGIFQISLGSSTAFNAGGFNVDFKQNNLYLDITFNGEVFGSRVQLASVPQAINAEQLSGVVATQSATGFTMTGGLSNAKTLTLNDSTTLATNAITFGGGEVVTFTAANAVTFTTTGTTSITLPTSGALLSTTGGQTVSGSLTLSTNSSTALTVGANGSTNPVLQIDDSTASVATGLSIKGAATGGTTALTVIDSGSNTNLSIDAKGTGTVTINGTATGGITLGHATTVTTGGLTVTAGNIAITTGALTMNGSTIITNAGVGAFITGTVIGSQTFTTNNIADSGALTIKSATTNALTIDSGTTGAVNIGTGANGKAITIGNNTANTSIALVTGGTGGITLGSQINTTLNTNVFGSGFLFQDGTISASGSGSAGTGSNAFTNALADEGSLLPNAGFESVVSGNTFADGWITAATSSATVTRDTTSSAKGTASMKVASTGTGQSAAIYSTCIPLAGQGSYNLFYYQVANAVNVATVRAYIDQYTSKANCQTNVSPTISSSAGTTAITATFASVGLASYTGATNGWSTGTTWGRVHFFVSFAASGNNVHIDGVRLIESSTSVGVDYAENYPADASNLAHPGDVVRLEILNGAATVIPDAIPQDPSAIGVISTNPGQVLDDGIPGLKVPVALAGRIPTHVSTLNGPIHAGDLLTTSSMPGVAVKATTSGSVIGIAMQDATDSDVTHSNQITMFVKNSYFNPVSLAAGLTGLPGKDTTISFDDSHEVFIKGLNTLTPGVSIDASGNAVFNGTITAKGIQVDQIVGIGTMTNQIALLTTAVASLSAQMNAFSQGQTSSLIDPFATQSAILAIATGPVASGSSLFQDLAVGGLATVSGDLRVKSNGIVEGIFTVVDTLMTKNILINGAADFFGQVIFHNTVAFQKAPQFDSDTAGITILKSGTDHVAISFINSYPVSPIVNATMVSLTPSADLQQTIFSKGYQFIVTSISPHGFTIQLNKLANNDLQFSWTAIKVASASGLSN